MAKVTEIIRRYVANYQGRKFRGGNGKGQIWTECLPPYTVRGIEWITLAPEYGGYPHRQTIAFKDLALWGFVPLEDENAEATE